MRIDWWDRPPPDRAHRVEGVGRVGEKLVLAFFGEHELGEHDERCQRLFRFDQGAVKRSASGFRRRATRSASV